jgi:sugar lactone lactonase YvrE
VAHYPLDGGANDSIGGGGSGTVLLATAGQNRFAQNSTAIQFPGNDTIDSFIDLGSPAALRFSGDFTVSAWVTMAGGGTNPRILSNGQDAGYELLTAGASQNRRFEAHCAGQSMLSTNYFSEGDWLFVLLQREGSTLRLFVNGVLEGSLTLTDGPVYNFRCQIGKKAEFDGHWGGMIDEVRFYDRALTGAEVVQLYRFNEAGTNFMALPFAFTTLVGTPGIPGGSDGAGTGASFRFPIGIAVAASGDIYVTDGGNSTIRRIAPNGLASVFAGTPGISGSTDGAVSTARFGSPVGLAFDSGGSLYVVEQGNHTIRKITPAGVVSLFAGAVGQVGSANGTGVAARFNSPVSIVIDRSDVLFVADAGNQTIRRITTNAVVSTLAGSPGQSGSANGTGTAARFNGPYGMAIATDGALLIADVNNNCIRRSTTNGVVTTFAGSLGQGGAVDGPISSARFLFPFAVAADSAGNIFVADSGNNMMRSITPGGVVTTIGGIIGQSGSADGVGSRARFNNHRGMTMGPSNTLFIADTYNHTIRVGHPLNRVSLPIQPMNQIINSGSSSFLTVAGDLPGLSYQWYQGVSGDITRPITGATGPTFITPPLSTNSSFWVMVQNSFSSVASMTANVTVQQTAIAPTVSLNMVAGLTIDGTMGARYRVEYATNLAANSWIALTNLTLAAPRDFFADLDSANAPMRFYRVVVP